MTDSTSRPGAHTDEKRGPTSDPGHPQPSAAEVESARLLANQARERLSGIGWSDDELRRLADEYIALDLGEDLEGFSRWAERRTPAT